MTLTYITKLNECIFFIEIKTFYIIRRITYNNFNHRLTEDSRFAQH